jgi:hypothetical protein
MKKSRNPIKASANRLKDISVQNLFIALEYTEKMAEGARAKTGQVLEYCKKTDIDPAKHLDDELRKLHQIFEEHNDLSLLIEKELDMRMKPMLKNKYGAKTLFDISNSLDDKIRELFIEFKEKDEKQKGLQLK